MKKLILLLLFIPFIAFGQNDFIGSVERLSSEMDDFISKDSKIEIIAKGFTWSEGPVWSNKLNAVLFSDVPNNIIYKWDEKNGLDIFLDKIGHSEIVPNSKKDGTNGLTIDQQGKDCFISIAPSPTKKESTERVIKPNETKFSGFIFKIHANMDPKHRDRLAFIKIVSGNFKRNMAYHHVRMNKKFKFSSPNAFFAEKKEIVNESFPGDIVGVHDSGNFKIGDTFSEGENIFFKGIPSFSPEHFRYINNLDPMKSKQLAKGIVQLMDEGVAQLFVLELNGRKVIGTVGALQFEVIQYRLEHEYGAKCSYENLNIHKASWVENKKSSKAIFNEFKKLKNKFLAKDKDGKLVFLSDSSFTLEMTKQKFQSITFHNKSEF